MANEGYVTVEDGRLYYETRGEGETVVFINPGALDVRAWDAQFPSFADRHRAVRYDPRGWGKSSTPRGRFSHVEDLTELLNGLEIETAHLVGVSFGGSLGIDVGVEHPERVASLSLLGAGGPSNGFPMPGELLEIFQPIVRAIQEDFEQGIDLWLEKDERMSRGEPEVVERIRQVLLDNPGYWKLDPRQIRNPIPPAAERLGAIHAPSLILVGEHDHPYSHQIADRLAASIPTARKVVIPGAGHLAQMETPELFNRLVLDFIDSL